MRRVADNVLNRTPNNLSYFDSLEMSIPPISRNRILLLFLFFLSLCSQAQTISGKVVDSKTEEPLPFANVFINNTTIGTVTDVKGDFTLVGMEEAGSYEVVFSYVGYETTKMKVAFSKDVVHLNIVKLKPSEIELSAVEVVSKRDKEWERDLKKFKRIFLGQDKQAAACTIINPWVIDFPKDDEGKRFLAKANAPIGIDNRALGYRILFYLTDFSYDSKGYSIGGNARFSELKSQNMQEIAQWRANRMRSYRQSTHALFKAIIDQRLRGEGFSLYREGNYIDNVITRSAIFNADLGKTVFEYDTADLVTPGKQKDTYRITFKGRVEVHDNQEKSSTRIYQDVFGPVSWISLRNNSILVNKNGFPLRPEEVVVSGDLSYSRVGNMLPLDYRPMHSSDVISASIYQEQVYVQTDKPYYYPGESIWFKGYINYAIPAWRDSLSSTVYVELIDRKRNAVVLSKTLAIRDGVFDNDFRLSDTLSSKTYYLRAYTNFNRNFGEDNLFVKPLPVLSSTEAVAPLLVEKDVTSADDLLSIETDKRVYKPREKITVTLRLNDEQIKSGNFSMTVFDTKQVVPIEPTGTILNHFPLKEMTPKPEQQELPFAIERGLTFSGRFLNDNNKPQMTALSILQLNPQRFTMSQAGADGLFSVSGLSFYDTAIFSIQGIDDKNRSYGHAEFVEREIAAINFAETDLQLKTNTTTFKQRVQSSYELSDDTRMLKEVVIRTSKVEEQYEKSYRLKRPYGKPDYILKAKDINTTYGNLLMALPGKIPGLIVRQVNNDGEGTKWVVYLQRQVSVGYPAEVIVTVNNAVGNGTPEQILSAIDPNRVESIEVKTGINVLYGSIGGNGIVAVYLKDREEETENKNVKEASLVKIPGYAVSREFESPDYSNSPSAENIIDYRSTIYWNPTVITNAETGVATVSFFAASLPNQYKIVVEGVLENGEPMRCEQVVQIDND